MAILERWSKEGNPTKDEIKQLLLQELANPEQASALGITPKNGLKKITERANLFLLVATNILEVCDSFGLKKREQILKTLWNLWLPLALQLADYQQKLGRTLIQGILGGQGTGKTTLAEVLRLILSQLGYSTVAVSIDDLYKTYNERQQLQKSDPRLIWRGPPGTHDIQLGLQLLEQLRQTNKSGLIVVPRFDKSAYQGAGDRTQPEVVEKPDFVLFEGWFVGIRPIDENVFDNAPPPILTAEDRLFAQDTNERLKEYLPLWEKLDRLIVLYPTDYHVSKQWRKEAEQKMIASGKSGMSDTEIEQFVEYFWQALHPELFITPLTKNPNLRDLVIEINADHLPGKVY